MAANKYNSIMFRVDDLYRDGHKIEKIAYLLDLDPNQVKYILYRRLKVQDSKPRKIFGGGLLDVMPRAQVSRCLTLSFYGYQAGAIAKDQGIPLSRVTRLLEEAREKKLL